MPVLGNLPEHPVGLLSRKQNRPGDVRVSASVIGELALVSQMTDTYRRPYELWTAFR
ncbi:hypothetical protein GCM10008959_41480 [Deinococcus seoulensis]|uniref:Uncharacterized protein n=1 Tax=Deinococcus seoulensis TaxID=1837379 RepID=A0ABQ2S1H5_9DEIO|nr:hypothetical protein GCM10008959_41480 [Deinococcus seoulensis]